MLLLAHPVCERRANRENGENVRIFTMDEHRKRGLNRIETLPIHARDRRAQKILGTLGFNAHVSYVFGSSFPAKQERYLTHLTRTFSRSGE